MRRSPLNHPLAVLRKQLGMGQKEMAKKLGCSWRAIQSIELGTLKLSAKMANKICDETGVHFHWLMTGDPKAPILDERGLPWSKEVYFDAQGRKILPGTVLGRHHATDLLNVGVAKLCAAMVAATVSENIRANGWRILDGLDQAAADLKEYPDLVHDFNQIMVNHVKDTKAGREAMLEAAMKVIRQWKEPRGMKNKVKTKGV
jgi:DNA-binding XRE family transcriptional regulator